MDGPTPMPSPPDEATPGPRSDTLRTPLCTPFWLAPPIVALGNSDNSSLENEVVRLVLVVFSVALASAETSIVVLAPRVSVMSAVAVLLSSTASPFNLYGWNPGAVTLISYLPGSKFEA